MGYLVRITPEVGRSGYLSRGNMAPAWSIGTYYHHPSAARKSGSAWLKKHPGGKAELIKFSDRSVLENILP